jgi:hypothetical protein
MTMSYHFTARPAWCLELARLYILSWQLVHLKYCHCHQEDAEQNVKILM